MTDWYAYDLKAKKKVKIINPRIVKMGIRYAVTGESEETCADSSSLKALGWNAM